MTEWDALSAGEQRPFRRQADVFAAFVEYTDHEIGRAPDGFEDVGIDPDTPVVESIGSEAASRFLGRIQKLTIEVTK